MFHFLIDISKLLEFGRYLLREKRNETLRTVSRGNDINS